MTAFKVKVELEIPLEKVAGLLCTGMESGSYGSFQIQSDKYVKPPKLVFLSSPDLNDGKPFKHIDYPCNPGGAMILKDKYGDSEDEYRIDLAALERGLNIMATKYPRHFADFMQENDDAITGDVFVQCCALGEIVYG